MRTLVVGASGHLGGEVARLASAAGLPVVGTSTTGTAGRSRLDITDRRAVLALFAEVHPAYVINAAYRSTSWRTCADGAANVALGASSVGARLVHVSSDALHGGRPAPYPDDEPPTPAYPYGAAKAAAETAVTAIDPAAALVRTSLIIGDERSRQVRLCLELTTGRAKGALFTDEIRCPIDATDLAAALLELAASDYAGTINVAGPEAMSRADLGRLVATRHGLNPADVPTSTIAAGNVGPRPAEIRLDSTRATALLKTPLRAAGEILVPYGGAAS